MVEYNGTTGEYNGYLCNYDGSTYSNLGPLTYGKQGTITRFYDHTENDYIDLIVDINVSVSTFSDKNIDIQLFPSLSLDEEIMLIGSCQFADSTLKVSYVSDDRSFGNTSEKDLSTSAINFITAGDRHLHSNGVIRGFEFASDTTNPDENQFYLNGGVALVNGKICTINDQTINVPKVNELYLSTSYNITWVLCVNDKSEYQLLPLLDADYEPTVHPTPITNKSRKFVATNPAVVSSAYSLEGVIFSDLINKRKDLTPIYLVRSVSAGTSLSISDVRRFVKNADDNLNLKYASNLVINSTVGFNQCNFSGAESIFNWLYLNNDLNGTVTFRNIDYTNTSEGIITSPISFDYSTTTYINGEGNSNILSFEGAVTFGSNISFKNITFVFGDTWAVKESAVNQYFENCTFIYESDSGSTTILDYITSANIVYNKCNFTVNSGNLTTLIGLTNTSNVKFIDCEFSVNIDQSDGVTGIVISTAEDTYDVVLDGNAFETNAHNIFYGFAPKDVEIKNNKFVWSYLASDDPDYDADNLVNYETAKGCVVFWYSFATSFNSTSNLNIRKNYIIDNNEFIFNVGETETNERYPFVLFMTSSTSANKSLFLRNIQITNNKFQTDNIELAGAYQTRDDYRAAIAVLNVTGGILSSPSTTIDGLNISNNICNRYQLIIVSSRLQEMANGDGMTFPGFCITNGNISNNICGSIGYWIQHKWVYSDITSINSVLAISAGFIGSIQSQLSIKDNSCLYIGSMDADAHYFEVSKFNDTATKDYCQYPSGHVTIENNSCSFIHTGIAYEEQSSLHILNNKLSAVSALVPQLFNDKNATNSIAETQYSAISVTSFAQKLTTSTTGLSPNINNDSSVIINRKCN